MQFYIFVLNLTFASWETQKGIHTHMYKEDIFIFIKTTNWGVIIQIVYLYKNPHKKEKKSSINYP